MEKFITVLQTVMPIFVVVFLGILARKRKIVSAKDVQGMQNCVVKFCLPCVLFNACLSAQISMESIASMILVFASIVLTCLWAFRFGWKKYTYHNFPMFYASMETGMLGIPLFMILFGADQAYRMGVLDLAQAPAAFPVIAILSANAGENPTPSAIVKKVLTSPLLIMMALGLALNLSGIGAWMDAVGIGGVITECTSFLGTPVSAMMIFSVGYNFSMDKGNSKEIFKISAIHFAVQAVFCVIIQLMLFLLPSVDVMTRWAILMYCTLPASYLAPTLGRSEEDFAMASGVCSILTVVSLAVFCVMAAVVA
jgi:predicted permease